jgi:hypothetical protein
MAKFVLKPGDIITVNGEQGCGSGCIVGIIVIVVLCILLYCGMFGLARLAEAVK